MQKASGSAQRSQSSSPSPDLPLPGVLCQGWPVNGISPPAHGRSYSWGSGCFHPFCSRCCRSFKEDFWERIPTAKDKPYELAQRIRSHFRSGQDPGRVSLRGFLFRDLRPSSCDRPRYPYRACRGYACRRLLAVSPAMFTQMQSGAVCRRFRGPRSPSSFRTASASCSTSCCESQSSIRVPVAGAELHPMPRSVPTVANRK